MVPKLSYTPNREDNISPQMPIRPYVDVILELGKFDLVSYSTQFQVMLSSVLFRVIYLSFELFEKLSQNTFQKV